MAETGIEQRKNWNNNSQERSVYRYICDVNRIPMMKGGAVAAVVCMTGAFVLTGTYSCDSIRDVAVLLSWLLLIVPLLLSWTALFRILLMGESITWKQYKKGPERLRQSGAFGSLISAVSLFCCGYFIVTGGVEASASEFGMLLRILFEFVCFAGTAWFGRYYLRQLEER